MKKVLVGLLILLVLPAGSDMVQGQQRAFPEAEGYGSYAKGGRGGQLLLVTNLNDSGPGSLREAVETEGPRTVLFEVGGIIDLETAIELRNPYITIAGHTAPSPGITIRGQELSIRAGEVIIRHIRFRPGDYLPQDAVDWGAMDAVTIRSDRPEEGPVADVILDHCSFSWGTDEVISIWHNARRITIQNSIISEGLRYHPYNRNSNGQGLLIGSNATDISVLRTLFASNFERNPYMNANGHLDFRNNIVYNGGDRIMRFFNAHGPEQTVNLVNNLILEGPESRYEHEIFIRRTSQTRIYNGRLWIDGNLTSRSPAAGEWNWLMVRDEESGESFPDQARAKAPFPVPETTTLPASGLQELLLPAVGAVLPRRDQVDRRIVQEVEQGRGEHVTFTRQVLGWGAVQPAERPVTALFERWRQQTGIDLADETERNRLDEQGYTALEAFLNTLAAEEPLPWQGGTASASGSYMATLDSAGSKEPGIRRSFPNPFRDQATIRIVIGRPENYRLEVFDIGGRRIETLADRWMVEGVYELQWEPGTIASGLYLLRLHGPTGQWVRPVTRLR